MCVCVLVKKSDICMFDGQSEGPYLIWQVKDWTKNRAFIQKQETLK